MCKIAIWNSVMKQDDIARVLNVSQSVVSRPLKEHRESDSIRKRKRSTLILECQELLLKHISRGARDSKIGKKWPESSRILDYILCYYDVSEV